MESMRVRQIFHYFGVFLILCVHSFADDAIDYGEYIIYDDEWILDHDDCATEDDPNYLAACHTVCRAIEKLFFDCFSEPYSFPIPIISESILDISGDTAFYDEGSICWDGASQDHVIIDETLKRTLQKAVQIDAPRYIFQGEDTPDLY